MKERQNFQLLGLLNEERQLMGLSFNDIATRESRDQHAVIQAKAGVSKAAQRGQNGSRCCFRLGSDSLVGSRRVIDIQGLRDTLGEL